MPAFRAGRRRAARAARLEIASWPPELARDSAPPARGGSRRTSSSSIRSRACVGEPSANRSCRSARVSFGSASYAASRMSRCRKRNAWSPVSVAGVGWISSLRTSPIELRLDLRRPRQARGRRRGGRSRPRRRRARSRRAPSRRAGRCAPAAAPARSTGRERRRPRATSATISSTKSGLPSAAARIRVRTSSASTPPCTAISSPHSSADSGSSRIVVAFSLPPPQPGPLVEQLRPCDAEDEDRCAAREVGDVVDEVEERLLAPLDVVEEDDERPLSGNLLELRTHRPEELVRRSCLPRRLGRASRPRAARVLQDRDDRPERDPLAVVEARARRRRRVDPGEELARRAATSRRRRRRAA